MDKNYFAKSFFLFVLVLGMLSFSLKAAASSLPEEHKRKIEASLLIEEPDAGIKLAIAARAQYPDDPVSYTLLIRSYGLKGDRGKMMEVWESFKKAFPDQAYSDSLLESMGFSIVKTGKRSSNLDIRKIALIAAALTEDMEGALTIKEALCDSNVLLRLIGVELAALYGDESLKEELKRLFKEERSKEVRKSLYKAIAILKVDLKEELMQLASKEMMASQEKGEILKAIVSLYEKVEEKDLENFAKSRSFLVRSLVAKSIAKSLDKDKKELLIKLSSDFHPEVKKCALEAMTILNVGVMAEIKPLAFSKDPQVGIAATRLLFLLDEREGEAAFRYWLKNERIEVRRKASAALASMGERGVAFISQLINVNDDPYILAHFALGLLRERKEVPRASSLLFRFLSQVKEPLMWDEEASYSVLEKSTVTTHPLIANFREATDSAVRLELLNLLAIVEYPQAKEAIRDYLKQKQGAVVGIAAEILLKEGDEEIIAILKEFLNSHDKKVRVEAALLLAALNENDCIPVLKGLYWDGTLAQKLTFLEALGRLGERELIPFFVEELKNPSETIRLASASMLIHTLRS